jgi:hypothetical protein
MFDMNHYETQCRRQKEEISILTLQTEELERRNRALTDKINSQIYSHAAEYKEKTS